MRELEVVDGPVEVGFEVLLHAWWQDRLAVLDDVAEWHLDRLMFVKCDGGVVLSSAVSELHSRQKECPPA